MLIYDIHPRVEAFSTEKTDSLPYAVVQAHQTHQDHIARIMDPDTPRDTLQGIDALITNVPRLAIGVRTADCVPILLYDPVHHSVAAIHSGWRGTVLRISQKTISAMTREFGTCPSDLLAVIGPSIGPQSFMVHDDVVQPFTTAGFPMSDICVPVTAAHPEDRVGESPSSLIDLWAANRWLLTESGIPPSNIQVSCIDTLIHHDRFFSARHERDPKCGRIINAIRIL